MKRLYLAAAVLLTICVIVGYGTYEVYNANNTMTSLLKKIEQSAKSDDIENAVAFCQKAEKEWINFEDRLTLFVNHAEICDIGVAISSMKPLIEHNEKAEFFSELNKVKVMLTHLSAMEHVGKEG